MNIPNEVQDEDQPLLATVGSIESLTRPKLTTVLYCLAIMVLISMSYWFSEAPLYRLYKSVLCKKYYTEHDTSVIRHDGSIPEEKCKHDSIQQGVAMVLTKQAQVNLWTCRYITIA